jgi:hypothetical protein
LLRAQLSLELLDAALVRGSVVVDALLQELLGVRAAVGLDQAVDHRACVDRRRNAEDCACGSGAAAGVIALVVIGRQQRPGQQAIEDRPAGITRRPRTVRHAVEVPQPLVLARRPAHEDQRAPLSQPEHAQHPNHPRHAPEHTDR